MQPETWVSPIHDRLAGKAPADRQPVKAASRRNLVAPGSPAAYGLAVLPRCSDGVVGPIAQD
jgi:hypothetical protein